jgi:hypothetical protein
VVEAAADYYWGDITTTTTLNSSSLFIINKFKYKIKVNEELININSIIILIKECERRLMEAELHKKVNDM